MIRAMRRIATGLKEAMRWIGFYDTLRRIRARAEGARFPGLRDLG